MALIFAIFQTWIFLACLIFPFTKADLYCRDVPVGMQNSVIPADKITASSGTAGDQARINYTHGPSWCTMGNDTNPYLQIDLGTPHIICAVATQGDHQAKKWVKTFKLSYSRDGQTFLSYKGYMGSVVQTFYGNVDGSGIVKQILYQGITARYLRILPMMHHGAVCMRAEIYGVQIQSENVALHKPAVQSSISHNGQASRAVDGNRNGAWSGGSCSHSDFTGHPEWWRVDLGAGILVSELSVFTRTHPRWGLYLWDSLFEVRIGYSTSSPVSNPRCGVQYGILPATRRITIVCEPPMYGRYLTIRQVQLYGALSFCEVEVYTKASSRLKIASSTKIQNTIWTASSTHSNMRSVDAARLLGNSSWRPHDDDPNPWLQIDLGKIYYVCAVATQGDPNVDERTKLYKLKWTLDGVTWDFVRNETSNTVMIYTGNRDRSSIVKHIFSVSDRGPILTRMLRVYPTDSNIEAALRVEVYGLPSASNMDITITSIHASSSQSIVLTWDGIFAGLKSKVKFLKVKLQSANGKRLTRICELFNGTVTIDSLQKWTVYKVTVTPFTLTTTGPQSPPKTVQTLEDAPSGSPMNFIVKMINSTSVNVSWELPTPESRNGMIRGFKIFYRNIGDPGPAKVLDVKDNTTRGCILTLEGFGPSLSYSFSILAYTVSNGPKSTVVITTMDPEKVGSSTQSKQRGSSRSVSTGTVPIAILCVIVVLMILLVTVIGWKLWKMRRTSKGSESFNKPRSMKVLQKEVPDYEQFYDEDFTANPYSSQE